MTQHRMILVSADFKTIRAAVIAKRKAPLALPEEPAIRSRETSARDADGAPQEREAA